ncbi:MAG TPA: TlpA disulfide reductase family protein [Pyrinomonadaceae bacterium]|nr:TlpA disulfide reductase family protein [Pyrinomonadaceae bacterium]
MKHYFHAALVSCLMLLMPAIISGQTSDSVKLEGQFVCSVCWFEADRKTTVYGTAADMDCARDCAENNIPPAIAVKENDDYRLVLVEEGKLKKPPETWLQYIGKTVSVTGRLRSAEGKQFIALDALTVTGEGILAQESAAIGTQPDLSLKDLFGVEQKLSAYRGKVVVLNFWATWCIPCRKEMPDLAAIQNEYAALGVQVVGASADVLTDRSKVVSFIKETGINFPVWLGATTEEMKQFGLGPALPGTAVVGRDGKLLAVKNGVITRDYLKKQIDILLASDAKVLKQEIAAARQSKIAASSVPS